jgi:hypothetical protein
MKGLKEYIRKYGRHFTKELAYDAVRWKWPLKDIEDTAQSKVYYNVTGSTLGDIVYLVHIVHDAYPEEYYRKDYCVDYALAVIRDVRYTGSAFSNWILTIRDFDFTPYI